MELHYSGIVPASLEALRGKLMDVSRRSQFTIIIRGSSNGRTTAFEAVYLGSNPGPRATYHSLRSGIWHAMKII